MLCHPHGYSWNTLFSLQRDRLFQRVVSGCKANTKNMWFCPAQDRLYQPVRHQHRRSRPWLAEYVVVNTFQSCHGKCTIIVVTTIVRFSTEEDSLVTCASTIYTYFSNSFQYPVWKWQKHQSYYKKQPFKRHLWVKPPSAVGRRHVWWESWPEGGLGVSGDARDKKPCSGAVLGDDALTSATDPVGEKSIQLSANLPLSTLMLQCHRSFT